MPSRALRTEPEPAPAKPQAKPAEEVEPRPKKAKKPMPDRRFRGAITRIILSSLVPGLGMLGTKAHALGLVLVALAMTGAIGLGFAVWRNPTLLAGQALQSTTLMTLAICLAVLAGLWAIIILGTYVVSRPRTLSPAKRFGGAFFTGLMSFLVSAPLAVGSAYSFETSLLSNKIFTHEDDTRSQTRPTLEAKDPWADIERVNILLLGADSGESRDEDLGVRTDTMIVASIDTRSGNTVLIQLPRNLENAIFPEGSELAQYYPFGFQSGGDTMLNAVWNDVPMEHPELFTDTDFAGGDALKLAIEGSIGLKMDYFVMVNIDGLVNMIDAMGGVTVNVNFPIAKHGSIDEYNCGIGGWIPQGPDQHLNGEDAMWYARSRCNDTHPMGPDFGRMQRQSCLIDAVINQANPANMVSRYEAIAEAAGNLVSTDIPQEHLSAMIELATRVQNSHNVSRLSFVNEQNGFVSAYPDFDLMKAQVAEAIAQSLPTGPVQPTEPLPTASDAPEPTEAQPDDPAGTETTMDVYSTQAPVENVTDACAFRLEESRIPAPEWAYYNSPDATSEENDG